jgi:hypothetical protein
MNPLYIGENLRDSLNRFISHPETGTMKIVKKSHIRESPASGPLRGTAGQITVFFIRRLIRRGGAPSGAAASIAIGGYGGFNPHHHI